MINPRQCRGARALLGMTQQELADLAGLSKRTVIEFEGGVRDPLYSTTQNLQLALEHKGIEFLTGNGGGSGVRFRDPEVEGMMPVGILSRRQMLGRVGMLIGGAVVANPLSGGIGASKAATKLPGSFAASEISALRFDAVASTEQKLALDLFRRGVTDVPSAVAGRATLARFEAGRQIIEWQGRNIRLFPKNRSLAGVAMADQPDAAYGRWAQDRVMRAFHRQEPIFELCRGLVEVDGSRSVWRYYSLRLPRPDGTTLNVTARA